MFSSRKTAAPSTGYNLTKSLRFRSSASAYMNRTPGVAGNRQKYTYSAWIKKPVVQGTGGSTYAYPITAGTATGGNTYAGIQFYQDTIVAFDAVGGGANNIILKTNAVYRDPSAWYHIVFAVDTTQATAANRAILYVNGSQITSLATATYPSQNYQGAINNTVNHGISAQWAGSWSEGDDLYLAEVYLIDGQQLTPSSFGSTNATTGVWQPAKYTGTYGTNGFYLPFTNTTSTTTLGYDSSGNSNNWTTNNLSLTAGSTYDSMTDVPTLTSATVANYCVLNPLDKGTNVTFTDGNLTYSEASGTDGNGRSTFGMSSGKWYWEATVTGNYPMIGISTASATLATFPGYDANGWAYWGFDGKKYNNNTAVAYGATYTTNDVIGVAFDAGAGTLTFYKNNTSQGTAYTGLTNGPYFPSVGRGGGTPSAAFNFGQQPFVYTPPTGFVALNTYNLPTSTIVAASPYFNANLYTGTGANATITTTTQLAGGALIWTKNRSGTNFNWDTRSTGLTNNYSFLQSNTTNAENTGATNYAMTFSNGSYTVGSGDNININGNTFVSYTWGLSAAVSNTNGSITSQVQANTTAGCSVVTYTGVGGLGTVGHGLGVAPSMIMVFPRSFVSDKYVYHASIGAANYLSINLTSASASTTLWNSTSPTSSVFTVNGNGANQSTSTFLAFCFAPIAGFSAFGSYTGNGSTDGTFVYTGFRPKFVLFKVIDSGGGDWYLYDSIRNSYNVTNTALSPNLSSAEYTQGGLDLLSNGFKFRASNNPNVSGANYIYMAFAENPFKNALAR